MSIRDDVVAGFEHIGEWSFDLAYDLAKIAGERAYRKWGFRSMRAWLQEDTHGHVAISYAYKLASVGQVFWSHREQARVHGITGLITAAKLVQDGVLSREEALSHLETDTLPEASGPTHAHPVSVPTELQELVTRAFNAARFELDEDDPSEARMWEVILTGWVDASTLYRPLLTHTMSDGRTITWSWTEVCDGVIHCKVCGAWDKSKLDPHHVIPRSHQNGSEGPIVLLCRACHQEVQPEWRKWAMEWGYGELLPPAGE